MRVAIVGAGYSGAMAAVEIARAAPGAEIFLIEKSGRFGEGAAYSTRSFAHVLNVRALNMSAHAEAPDHFAGWAGRRGYDPDDYVPRAVYRDYLQEQLASAPGIRRVAGEAVAVEDEGLRLGSGETIACEAVVLAGGNYPSRLPDAFAGPAIDDPWSETARKAIARVAGEGGEVLLVGTGLTMVDMCLSLDEAGFKGRITATSRRGLVPRAQVRPLGEPLERPLPERLGALLREVRSHENWRSSVDGLRAHSHRLWKGLSEAEKRRFLRHLRPWWDVHRHRIAPKAAAGIEALREAGRLEVVAGRISRVEKGEATIVPRGGAGELRRRFDLAINCTGPQGNIERVEDPLVRQLLASGRGRAAALALGFEIDGHSRVAGCRPSPALYAVGPLTRGAFWEIVAVPDIRVQLRGVAEAIATL